MPPVAQIARGGNHCSGCKGGVGKDFPANNRNTRSIEDCTGFRVVGRFLISSNTICRALEGTACRRPCNCLNFMLRSFCMNCIPLFLFFASLHRALCVFTDPPRAKGHLNTFTNHSSHNGQFCTNQCAHSMQAAAPLQPAAPTHLCKIQTRLCAGGPSMMALACVKLFLVKQLKRFAVQNAGGPDYPGGQKGPNFG